MMRVFVYEHLSGGAEATDAGSDADAELLAAGVAMRDAVAADLLRAGDCAVSVAAGPHAPAVPAGARAVRPAPGVSAVDFMAAQAGLHDRVWAIAPETGGVLARLCRAVGAERWLGCEAGAIELASSKRATLARAAEHGVLTPLNFATLPSTCRWVVKPDDGAGALDTRVHDTLAAARDDAKARRRRGESPTLEAWVAGEPLSLSLCCRQGRCELLSVNLQQIAVDAIGRLSFDGVQIDALAGNDQRRAVLRDWAAALVAKIGGLRGYIGIDLVWHAQCGPVLIEINPRVTMAYVGLSAALGRNLAAAVLAAHGSLPTLEAHSHAPA